MVDFLMNGSFYFMGPQRTQFVQSHMTTALEPGLHGDQHRDFATSPTAPFAGLFLPPDIGIIQLNQTLKAITRIPVLHGFTDLVTPTPGGRIREPEIILDLASRGAGGPGGHQVDCPEPVPKRFSGFMKDRVGGDCGLMQTTFALILPTRGDQIGLIMATAGTTKTIRPLALDEISEAVALRTKPSSELSGGHRSIQGSPPLYRH